MFFKALVLDVVRNVKGGLWVSDGEIFGHNWLES